MSYEPLYNLSMIHSPNFDKFRAKLLKKNRGVTHSAFRFTDPDDKRTIVGFLDDGDVIGTPLSIILTTGALNEMCYPALSFKVEEIPDFLEQYDKHGICYLDPEHNWYSGRWKVSADGNTRTCLGCGRVEARQVKQKIVETTHWEVV